MACPEMEDILDKFNSLTEKPVKFLSVQSNVKDDIKNLVKSLYNYTKSKEEVTKKEKRSALSELIIQDFDEEQIWQQLELQNSECWDQLVWEVANSMSVKNDLIFPVETRKHGIYQSENSDDDNSNDFDDASQLEDHYTNSDSEETAEHAAIGKEKLKLGKKSKTSIVDDKFFKLQDMEQFLLREEKNEGKPTKQDSDEESIDMFEDIDDEDEDDEKQMMYQDFFDPTDGENDFVEEGDIIDSEEKDHFQENVDHTDEFNQEDMEDHDKLEKEPSVNKKKINKKVHFAQDTSSDDEDSDHALETTTPDEKKSDFELRQQRLKQQIRRLEEKTLKDAPWQLKGEVDAKKRPQNSLLQEVVDFDLTSRPPPIITEQTTLTLEDIIKQRVKDKAWDDVVKKEKPVDDQLSFQKKEIIDQSKSKLSLAQVYEAEYLKQKQALSGEDQEEKEPEAHVEIRDTMSKLFAKLDALCHYHYTPKPAQAEVKIVSNTPAISMEEVAPVATSDAMLLAPEEVKKKLRGDLVSKEERTQTDKNRERRKKKKLQRKKGKVNKVTEQRNTKKGTEADDKSLKTSKAFFQQLNDDSKCILKNKRNVKNKGQ
ncbi:hypothetical protein K1T71_013229 [Dendrolimus kikuchii]|uniref:Uncharacterized protein n=1 Tax=Dendrolimus kikuchii TaxID=765133 RepID=A0ACC1CHH0_9NEOP|nr:hypothetical protein K1T71_013229 [Dendrolimus kikuchii]